MPGLKGAALRFLKWLRANPLFGLLAAVLAALGATGLRVAYLRRRTDALQDAAHRARVKARVAEAQSRMDALHARGKALEESIEIAKESEVQAAEEAAKALDERRKIAGKYRKTLPCAVALALAAAALPAGAADTTAPAPPEGVRVVASSCGPDADLSGLLDMLESQIDSIIMQDAAAVIRGYRGEREAMCERVDALVEQRDLLTERLTVETERLVIAQEMAETYRVAWTEALAARRGSGVLARLRDSVRATGGWGAISDAEGTVRGGWGVMVGVSVPLLGAR